MAVRFYDKAIYDKIQSWITDGRMRVLKPDETARLFRNTADLVNDQPIKLPLIALSRDRNIHIDVETKRNLTYDGKKVGSGEAGTMQLNAIPISLNYQIDIYCSDFDEADEYWRQFTINLINHPKIEVELPYYKSKIKHVAFLRMFPDVVDNSDIPERLYEEEFTRFTIQFELQDAYIFNTPINPNAKIDGVELKVVDNSTIVDVEVIKD